MLCLPFQSCLLWVYVCITQRYVVTTNTKQSYINHLGPTKKPEDRLLVILMPQQLSECICPSQILIGLSTYSLWVTLGTNPYCGLLWHPLPCLQILDDPQKYFRIKYWLSLTQREMLDQPVKIFARVKTLHYSLEAYLHLKNGRNKPELLPIANLSDLV